MLLTPNSRRPLDQPRLSKMVRTALIRGGMEHISLGDLCGRSAGRTRTPGCWPTPPKKAPSPGRRPCRCSACPRWRPTSVSGSWLSGESRCRVGGKYYPAGQVVPPEEQYDVIRTFLEQSGPAYRQDLAALLHVGDRQCALILKHMVEDRRLVQAGQRYALPIREEVLL